MQIIWRIDSFATADGRSFRPAAASQRVAIARRAQMAKVGGRWCFGVLS